MRLVTKPINLDDDLDWDELIKSSKTTTFFQTKELLQLWVKHWGKDFKVVIYAVFDNDELIGIAPFSISDKINILGAPSPSEGGSLSDFGDITAKTSYEEVVWKEVLANIKYQISNIKNTNQKLKIEFNFVREDSPSYKILNKLGRKVEEMEVSPYINLPKTWDEYLSTLNRHNRHELRRKMRKLEAEGVIKTYFEGDSKQIEEFLRLMALSNEQKRDFLSERMRYFFKDIIETFYPKKQLSMCFLKQNNEYMAGAMVFLYNNEVLLYNSGFDPAYSYLAPGLILKAYMIKQAIEEGKKRFDFLRGGEKYKYDLGGKERKLYKVIL